MLTALEFENFKGIGVRPRVGFAPITLPSAPNSATGLELAGSDENCARRHLHEILRHLLLRTESRALALPAAVGGGTLTFVSRAQFSLRWARYSAGSAAFFEVVQSTVAGAQGGVP